MKNLPLPFLERMKSRFETEEFLQFQKAYEVDFTQSIRLNPKKPIIEFQDYPSVFWNEDGKYLEQKRSFITDPLWHAGTYYVQEASSMILKEVFKQIYPKKSPELALDLCAAPGGKSTLLQSLLDKDSVLIANEVIKSRVQILKENHIRLGISQNLILTQNDPKDFTKLEEFFDYIQVDAPCSGEGMFRRDEIALKEWSEANCQLCSERQKRILANIAPTLAKDGYLVYSTCSFNSEENENLMNWFCQEFDFESVSLHFPLEWGISEIQSENCFAYYFYPHKVKGEGLFLSVLQKKSGYGKKNFSILKPHKNCTVSPFIQVENCQSENGTYRAVSPELTAVLNEIKNCLNPIYYGVELGELKGKDFIPAQALANFHKKLHHFPEVEISKEEALEFLRGNDPNLALNQKGIYLINYRNSSLGWLKFIGNRSNNYYPKPWRIKYY